MRLLRALRDASRQRMPRSIPRRAQPTPAIPPSLRNRPPPEELGPKFNPDASKEGKQRLLGIRLLMMSVPLFAISSYMMYKRVYLGEEQKKQIGFVTEDGIRILFSDLPDSDERKPKE
ncbi:hypothetical protein BZA70DRAFT_267012 [Myxozyma melibiosi]|uniref:Uncharacterized protein n=1 Tax=Myxozyma melibiosi TaxID=54550 RepID=A0ABR1F9S1_9ASCO